MTLLLAACGARSALYGEDVPDVSTLDASPAEVPNARDANLMDRSIEQSAPDVLTSDVVAVANDLDAMAADSADVPVPRIPPIPPIPPIDASVGTVGALPCADGDDPTAYLVAESGAFYTFDPPSRVTKRIGTLSCPTTSSPYTMTVSARGAAYVLYWDWNLYRVDLESLACTQTPYVSRQLGFPANVGIAILPSAGTGTERLLVYGYAGRTTLASSDLTTFTLAAIGQVAPSPIEYPMFIQADARRRLFALSYGGQLAMIDPSTAAVLGQDETGFSTDGVRALLTWRDRLIFFGRAQGAISEYDLTTKQLTPVGAVGDAISGAGAAPCMR